MQSNREDSGSSDRFAAVGELMARAILRKRRGDIPASSLHLIHDSFQSDTCAREAGLKVQKPGNGAGRTGLAENSHTGEDV